METGKLGVCQENERVPVGHRRRFMRFGWFYLKHFVSGENYPPTPSRRYPCVPGGKYNLEKGQADNLSNKKIVH